VDLSAHRAPYARTVSSRRTSPPPAVFRSPPESGGPSGSHGSESGSRLEVVALLLGERLQVLLGRPRDAELLRHLGRPLVLLADREHPPVLGAVAQPRLGKALVGV